MVPCLALELGEFCPPNDAQVEIDWDRWLRQENQVFDSGLLDSLESVQQFVPLNLQLRLMGFEANQPFQIPDSRLTDPHPFIALAQLLSPPRMPPIWTSKWAQFSAENAPLDRNHRLWETRTEFEDLDNLRARTALNKPEIQVWIAALLESSEQQGRKFFNFAPIFETPQQAPDFARFTKWTGAEWAVQDPLLFKNSSFCSCVPNFSTG